MRKVVKSLRSRRDIAHEVLESSKLHYLKERILPASWYPIVDYWALLEALTKVMVRAGNMPEGVDPWEHLGRLGAREDIKSFYKSMLHDGDPLATLQARSATWGIRFSGGSMEVSSSGEARAVLTHTAPAPDPPAGHCSNLNGYNLELLEQAGAVSVGYRKLSCLARGDEACSWEYVWNSPAV